MLSRDDNELLCRVGPGTPMGNLMREYWIPALPSSEFPDPDSPPKRMMLLGENLVMFRDSDGRVCALQEACPHRGASLYFGRNEDCGLRCSYHGWKFDGDGTLVDVPTEQRDSRLQDRFKRTIRARAYPCHDVNHMVWIYLGSRSTPPPFPELELNTLPIENVAPPVIMMEEANWLQNIEGDLDSAHLDFVHRRTTEDAPAPPIGMPGFWNPDPNPPRLDVQATPWGAFYTSMRTLHDQTDWHRINNYIFPFHTTISIGETVCLRSFVPIDDHHAMLIHHVGNPAGPMTDELSTIGWGKTLLDGDPFSQIGGYQPRTNDPRSYFVTTANKSNDYLRDPHLEETSLNLGIPFIGNLQDRAMTELMCGPGGEPLYDRTQEHLGSSDHMIVTVRKQLLNAVRRHRDTGEVPPNVDDGTVDRVRSASMVLDKDADWRTASADVRRVGSGEPVAAVVPLILSTP